jgi:hypothetical protein
MARYVLQMVRGNSENVSWYDTDLTEHDTRTYKHINSLDELMTLKTEYEFPRHGKLSLDMVNVFNDIVTVFKDMVNVSMDITHVLWTW